eukprot:TRINITY_DN69516_c0_g1_i1.p1 TRINITY_DN69516_c0_g1~~TRINITY_DN69516_c0_g1_i1.p1  ORF type:complete len:145 (-),score=23.10 TRINITY_DN69516_c0_g1_i1:28-462(-)
MSQLFCRFSKIKNNRLLGRVQMVVDAYHSASENVTKEQLREAIKNKFKKNHIVLLTVKKLFGGGRTKGFALVYDNEEAMKKTETVRRLDREERERLAPKDRKKKKKKDGRKVRKIRKHQQEKKRGTKRRQEANLKRKQDKKKKK